MTYGKYCEYRQMTDLPSVVSIIKSQIDFFLFYKLSQNFGLHDSC